MAKDLIEAIQPIPKVEELKKKWSSEQHFLSLPLSKIDVR